ncbi:agrin-like [Babylonia areolata]|uniref:agrin-like n=1 Tax=Babylonia areolata TaxID=304850 RepID=UPI003FD3677E
MATTSKRCWSMMAVTMMLWWSSLSLSLLLSLSWSAAAVVGAVPVECGVCEEERCPELHYCEGEAVKDHCGCCTVCSSSKYQPHPLITNVQREGSACRKVDCPKFKVCVENIQGLPLCTCPSDYICRNRKKRLRPVCGTDGVTYDSRCHLRIAACNSAVKIKVARKGPCSGLEAIRHRSCESFSTCRKRKNQQTVCGTDGKSYMSRCHMKIVACQKAVKIKLKSLGTCPPATNHAPSSQQRIGTSGVARDTGSSVVRTRRQDRGRKWKKSSGNDVSGSDDSKASRRRRQRREKRKKRKERRRKRRKAKKKKKQKKAAKSRSHRFKLDKNLFDKAFGHITWK